MSKSQVKFKIGGKEYPCRLTLGAMRRFKRETGKDVSLLKESDIDDIITLMFCCTASTCNADSVSFEMSLDDFADNLDADGIKEFLSGIEVAGDGQKKSPER